VCEKDILTHECHDDMITLNKNGPFRSRRYL